MGVSLSFFGALLLGVSSISAQVDAVLTPQSSGTTELLQAVSPVSSDVVWVSGHGSTYATTVDGGRHWRTGKVEADRVLQFRDVAAFDASTAYLMSAGPGSLSRVYRTDNGGDAWRLLLTATEEDAFYDCMDFWSPERGLLYGDAVDGVPFILMTDDGGRSWSRVAESALPPALEGEGGFAASGSCVDVGPDGRAWIAMGNGARTRILRTDDYGVSWSLSEVPVLGGAGAGLTTVQLAGDFGVALGGAIGEVDLAALAPDAPRGRAAFTENGGAVWEMAPDPSFEGAVYGAALSQERPDRVLVVGPEGFAASVDGGRGWSTVDGLSWWAVAFFGEEVAWAVGPEGRIGKVTFQ